MSDKDRTDTVVLIALRMQPYARPFFNLYVLLID